MKRLLCLVSAMNTGGAETFLMKIYRKLDRTRYQMDFCVNIKEEGFYDAEIKSMGGKIFHIPSKSENRKEFAKQLFSIVKDNGYKNVLRITSNAMGFYDLHIAKKAGAVNCIARSSNSSDGGSLKSKIAHRLGALLFKKDVDVKIAPSDLAAIYTFGKKDYEKGEVKILHNGIDLEEYSFSEKKRKDIRSEFSIDNDCYLLGHIGRFATQKNHAFLIDLFCEVHKKHDNTMLLLIGEGELKKDMEQKVAGYGLEKNVIFAGVRKDIPALLSAMDLFAFPSLYEGMPNTVIEAQATGLKCLISDTITKEVCITDSVAQMSIEKSEEWANKISGYINEKDLMNSSRKGYHIPEEYNILNVCEEFESFII